MRVSPIFANFSSAPKVNFGSIYPNFNSDNMSLYLDAFERHPEEHKLKPYATRIFRELPTELAMAKIIDYNKPTSVKIFGTSDGSEVYAWQIAMNEASGGKAKNNVKITAVDKEPAMIEMAKSGYIVCSDLEKKWANDSKLGKSPLAGDGWDKYLQKSEAPENFEEICKKYPMLKQITRDTVSNIKTGKGMDWYKVNTDNMCQTEFICDDMQNQIKRSPDAKQQVYILSNSAAYIAKSNPVAFIKLFEKIQNENYNKNNTYVILGDTEHQVIEQLPLIANCLKMYGYNLVSRETMLRKGANPKDAYGNILKLEKRPKPIKIEFKC